MSVIDDLFHQLKKNDFLSEETPLIWRYADPAMRHNAHVHIPPNFSAFSSSDQLVSLAKQQGLTLLGVSNYYDFQAYPGFAAKCLANAILPIFGLEILAFDPVLAEQGIRVNDPKNPGKVYLCGKGLTRFESPSPRATAILEKMRRNDGQRISTLIAKLNEFLSFKKCALTLDEKKAKEVLSSRYELPMSWIYLQERHVIQALHMGILESPLPAQVFPVLLPRWDDGWDSARIQNELRNELIKTGKPAYVPESYISVSEALELIDELGGIPVYPVVGDGIPGISELERDGNILHGQLGAWNIKAMEWIPTRNSPSYLNKAVLEAVQKGYGVTSGTEHNTPIMEPMLPACLGGVPIPEELQASFAEGLLNLANHQCSILAQEKASHGRHWLSLVHGEAERFPKERRS